MIDYSNLIGIPFKFDGDDLNGMDCYNLFRAAYRLHGFDIPKTNISVCACKDASNNEIKDNIIRLYKRINVPEVPCGVLIKSSQTKFADHIGFYIGEDRILHTRVGHYSSIEKIDPRYKTRIMGYYRFVGDK